MTDIDERICKVEWKAIPGYKGYEVSSMGEVRSLNRIVKRRGRVARLQGKQLKKVNSKGYFKVSLYDNGHKSVVSIHALVAIAFLGHKPNGFVKVVDHINNNSLDNRLENLQVITHRENTSKDKKTTATGVAQQPCGRWQAVVFCNKKSCNLGSFPSKGEAARAYQDFVSGLPETFDEYQKRNNERKKWAGIRKKRKKWEVSVKIKNKANYIGTYETKGEALAAKMSYLSKQAKETTTNND